MGTSWSSANQISNFKFSVYFRVSRRTLIIKISSSEEPANSMSIHRVRNGGKLVILFHPFPKSITERCRSLSRKLAKARWKYWNGAERAEQTFLAHAQRNAPLLLGATSRAMRGGWRKDRSTSGQRVNKFNASYKDMSLIVAENNSVVKPKCQQYTSLNKILSNFSKVFMAHIYFSAILNNGGIGKGIGCIRKGTKKNYIYVL